MRGDTTNLLIIRSIRSGSGNDIRVGKSELLASKRSSVSSVRNGNGSNNKLSARNIRGWVSENVSSVWNFRSVRNGNGIRGRVESSRGWARGRAKNSVRKTRVRGRVGNSGLLASKRLPSKSVLWFHDIYLLKHFEILRFPGM